MKSFRGNNRGQFVVIAALLIAALTLSVALSVHQIYLHRQQLRYEPVEELVLGLTSDLDRCLTHSLSIATQVYHGNRSLGLQPAISRGENFIFKWVRSVRASYAHLGINVTLSAPSLTNVKWTIDWNNPRGISHVYTQFNLDIDAYGFKGWVGRSSKFVSLEILDVQNTTVQFRIRQGSLSDLSPIPNLTPESLFETRIHIDDHFWASYPELEVTKLTYLGDGVYTATFNHAVNTYTKGVELTVNTPEDNIVVSARHYVEVKFIINLQSQYQNSSIPTNKGQIEFNGHNYTLPKYSLETSPGLYMVRYFPEEGYEFKNWTTTEKIIATNPTLNWTWIGVGSNGNITAFYGNITTHEPGFHTIHLESRQWENSTSNLGIIIFDFNNYTLPRTLTGVAEGTYELQYVPENSSYRFLWWEWTGKVIPYNHTSAVTTIMVYGDGNVTAVYSFSGPGEDGSNYEDWDVLYLCDLPPSMLLPFSMLPYHYFNPRSSTLPIPPRDSWQYIDVCTPPTEKDMTLAKYANITLYIQLASDKAESVGMELKFTYNNKTYFIGGATFNVEVGEAWYYYVIDTDLVNKVGWPVPGEPIIPANSTITITLIVPPNSGTLHIIYGWDRYQSIVDMFEKSE